MNTSCHGVHVNALGSPPHLSLGKGVSIHFARITIDRLTVCSPTLGPLSVSVPK